MSGPGGEPIAHRQGHHPLQASVEMDRMKDRFSEATAIMAQTSDCVGADGGNRSENFTVHSFPGLRCIGSTREESNLIAGPGLAPGPACVVIEGTPSDGAARVGLWIGVRAHRLLEAVQA